MSVPRFTSFQTAAVHAGQDPDATTGAVIPALSLATTFKQKSPGQHTVRPAPLLLCVPVGVWIWFPGR